VRRKESSIPSLSPSTTSDSFATGTFPGAGTYFCIACGSQLALQENESLPDCPCCGSSHFRLDSIFESLQEHEGTTVEHTVPVETGTPAWLEEAREELGAGVRGLACRDGEELIVFAFERSWTRIGRSVTADVQLDDPSVSRRHALIVSEADESLRVLDDRSLNGVFVNGEAVEWGRLSDGDELTVGRYRLFVLEG
jgi:hypothetical protein